MDKKKLFLWCLYDYANSIVWGNFLLYFTRWIVVSGGLSDLAFNFIFVMSAIIMLVIAPRLAAKTDRDGGLVKYLSYSTIGMGLFLGLAALFPVFSWNAYLAALMFFLGFTFYQMSFVFFNPLLNDVADAKHRGRASGWTQFANASGMMCGLVVFAPLAHTGIGALLPSVIAFVLLSLPIMLLYKENNRAVRDAERGNEKIDFRKFMRLLSVPGVAAAMLSFFFFQNANGTMSNNLSIYTKQVLGISTDMHMLILIGTMITTALGSLAGGVITDRLGSRKVLMSGLGVWMVMLPFFAAANDFMTTFFITSIMGFFLGVFWAASRAYTSSVLPPKDLAYGFSFYTIFERFSSILGPLVWGLLVSLAGSYRLALGSLSVFALLGLMSLFVRTGKKPAV
ncbi:MAG: MFS transporter [Rickettsiales bacterium]|jgi:UMF1 family MFS transporter|nr:MFS transporter [Rickettsiales bacterium]